MPPARMVHCAAFCSIERSVSLIRAGAGGGPAGLVGTAADDDVAAKKDSLERMGGEDAPRAEVIDGVIDVVREAACEMPEEPEEPDARTAPGALRLSDERDTSARRAAPASTERSVPRVAAVGAPFDGPVPAALAARAAPANPAPGAFPPAPCSRIPAHPPAPPPPPPPTRPTAPLPPTPHPLSTPHAPP